MAKLLYRQHGHKHEGMEEAIKVAEGLLFGLGWSRVVPSPTGASSMTFRRLVFMSLLASSALGLALGSLKIPRLYKLSREGRQTGGIVTGMFPENDRTLRYEDIVGSHRCRANRWAPNCPGVM
jgi:hypothetical protein